MSWQDSNAAGSTGEPHFAEPGSAARYAKLLASLPDLAAALLPQLLDSAGDADQAVRQLEALLESHGCAAGTCFGRSDLALRACVVLFGASQWLGQTLLQHPELIEMFARPHGLAHERTAEELREQFARMRFREHQTELARLLARFKRREYVRIFLRELLGLASLAETVSEISVLTDVLIQEALAHCENELRRQYQGWPQLLGAQERVYPARFAVVALGKLGGNELNYSSDIDLLYLYDDGDDARSLEISAREFFTRLAQELTSLLSTISPEGQLFRVDLRLRPQGASGEMVTGYAQALRYYSGEAHDWELQALLKLRAVAGDRGLAQEFAEQAQALIYSEQLSLSAIRTAAHSLDRIRRGAVRRSGRALDVKNGSGGIREIEFLVQCLQRVHGGGEPWLRSSGTLFALQKLHDKGHIGDAEFRELFECYRLLRGVEHRLQCSNGVQLHRLPESKAAQQALFRSMAEPGLTSVDELRALMQKSNELCERVLRLGEVAESGEVAAHNLALGSRGTERLVRELSAQSAVLAMALSARAGDAVLGNLHRFLAAASTSEERSQTAIANAKGIQAALPVFAHSGLATELLARYPEEIGALFSETEAEDGISAANRLRVEARRAALRTVGRSLLELQSVWAVLRQHTESFDIILHHALQAAGAPEGFAVLAVGRMGTCELDVLSDADLVFVRGTGCGANVAEQCAREMVTLLSSYTREGSVIAVDTRVRPHGKQGELVVSSRQLAHYFESEAKAWEVLAFGKLRWIAGDREVADEALAALNGLRKRFANSPEFVRELRAMRQRLVDSCTGESFKTGPGGLYDLDFMAGLLEARTGLIAAGRQYYERLKELEAHSLITPAQHDALYTATELFREVDHAVRLVEGRSRRWLPENDLLRASVEALVGAGELAGQLRLHMREVRKIYDLVFKD